jgi:hypothetical protein
MKKIDDTAGQPSETESLETLSPSELADLLKQLRKREHIIQETRQGWKAAPTALTEIRDRRLYRAKGFHQFESYCKKEIKLGKSTVNRYIAVGEVYTRLASTGAKVLPTTERQMRPLLALRNSETSPKVWGSNVEKVWERAVNDAELMTKKCPTEKSVIRAMEHLGFATPKEVPPAFDLDAAWKHLESLLWDARNSWPTEVLNVLERRLGDLLCQWKAQCSNDSENVTESHGEHDLAPATVESASVIDAGEPAEDTEAAQSKRLVVWPQVNWKLRNADIAAIWGVKTKTVKQTRYRQKRGPAPDCDPTKYAELLAAEKEKVKKLMASPD